MKSTQYARTPLVEIYTGFCICAVMVMIVPAVTVPVEKLMGDKSEEIEQELRIAAAQVGQLAGIADWHIPANEKSSKLVPLVWWDTCIPS